MPSYHSRPQPVRTAARALLINEGKLLAVKMRDRGETFYVLPGGGQQSGETLPQTLLRECAEEVGLQVEVGPLVYVREYIGRNHDFAYKHRKFHQVEHVFRCYCQNPHEPNCGHETDRLQVGVAWLDLSRIEEINFYPKVLKPYLKKGDSIRVEPLYLGDCN